ncbi:protein translocase subunit SecF [Rhodospirillum centenum]|uniref:Protein-export membrane protein SecF n=1 Tax=Rhodospirillum centenum (strain ATCC 51521 / SW) TaxID=414684 RepID=B6ISI3_RHOCS|nr:protein translocase subunit SecF [Rhodospirillum centenum]ACI98419.1 protein-export membrane protein SecF, putative [Rhodospirillum centenum SW]
MKPLRLVPDNTAIDFVKWRFFGFGISLILVLITIGGLFSTGLNLGIDFRGGILIEARAQQTIDSAALRQQLGSLGLGEVQLQQFGGPNDVLIRVQQQEGGDAAQNEAVQKVRTALGDSYEYRRVELVGPRVGGELMRQGAIATVLAIMAIAAYVAFRFEWQFGVSALIATFHDVFVTLGLFIVLQLEFDLTAVAALLTLAGYSINDTVVVFDRMREQMRKHKSADLKTIINMSVNQTLGRTILTSGTTLLAILPLLLFGGSALHNFTLALFWGILVGTFSSIYVAASILLYLPAIRRGGESVKQGQTAGAA